MSLTADDVNSIAVVVLFVGAAFTSYMTLRLVRLLRSKKVKSE